MDKDIDIDIATESKLTNADDASGNDILVSTIEDLFERACKKHTQDDVTGAKVLYGQVLKLHSGHAGAYNNLGLLAKKNGDLSKALEYFTLAVEIMPDHVEALNNLAGLHLPLGRSERAELLYQKALAVMPDSNRLHSNLLLCRQYQPGITAEQLFEAHKAWGLSVAPNIKPQEFSNSKDADRKIRLGFVSNGLGLHPVGFFSVGMFEHLDKEQFEIHCYSDRKGENDELTKEIRGLVDSWVETSALSLSELSEQIKNDEIDILYDLYGHTDTNRLLMFADKTAPIQITWAGYVGTTGVHAMDYLMADRFHVPETEEHFYHEEVLRMPNCYICYTPPKNCPSVASLPMSRNGYITFGCFNNPAKINDKVLIAWAHILDRVPSSQLLLKYRGMNDPLVVERISRIISHFGIDMERVKCLPYSTRNEFLDTYNEVDIALDTFPYSGGVTTCEALWMGVPVITKPGKTFAGRHSFSHLSNTGLTETIATNTDEYIKLAEKLAKDATWLSNTRLELRAKMTHSPLCDAERFSKDFAKELRQIWKKWCETSS
ncbi:MAG: tetratricopeptide repeat protein [Alphaproteobacteria bacterium]|nr:tetratricopeptide repeat protein [Alphaproteobacteria bacterium]